MKHKHVWKVEDYDDTDPGIIFVVCKCGKSGKAVTTKKELKDYQKTYEDGYPELMYLPELTEGFEKLLKIDAKALGIKTCY